MYLESNAISNLRPNSKGLNDITGSSVIHRTYCAHFLLLHLRVNQKVWNEHLWLSSSSDESDSSDVDVDLAADDDDDDEPKFGNKKTVILKVKGTVGRWMSC